MATPRVITALPNDTVYIGDLHKAALLLWLWEAMEGDLSGYRNTPPLQETPSDADLLLAARGVVGVFADRHIHLDLRCDHVDPTLFNMWYNRLYGPYDHDVNHLQRIVQKFRVAPSLNPQ